MRKFAMFLLIVGVAIVIAAIYGVGHDQVTYSISPEYYTKYKFIQFNLADSGAAQHMTQPRSAVVMVGVKATWWMGLIIGVVLGLFALIFRNADDMFQSAMQALGIALLITLLSAFIGWLYAHNILLKQGVGWWIPPNVIDKPAFITAGTIHNASYLGAAVGLLAGIVFLLIKNTRRRKRI
jgi:tetrahydromethanopterin S-methyltransferase subunit F